MGKIPQELRDNIGRNIRSCRKIKFPGRGGSKRCAVAFGVSPQQWSPWERGIRVPDEVRLREIADFFGVTVEYLRKDNDEERQRLEQSGSFPIDAPRYGTEAHKRHGGVPGSAYEEEYLALPTLRPDPPGSRESFFWLLDRLVTSLMAKGLRISLDRESAAYLQGILKRERGHM